MKLEFIIKNLIQNNKIKTQFELADILEKKGFNTTQSNISRILKKINTVKLVDENKESYYVIRSKPLEVVNWIKNLILNIDANGYVISIKTYSGAGNIIAQIIDERNIDNIMATVAGDNTIIIYPNDIKNIDNILVRIKSLFLFDEK